jgi:DUF1680 family protein
MSTIFHTRKEAFQFLRLGEIRPGGWMRIQMQNDLEHGFVGHLDQLVPDLIQRDEIYGADRLTKAVKTKDLGVVAKETPWEVQFLWWNSETQSNWLDGLARTALLLDHQQFLEKTRRRVERLLATQDSDGYLGIYAPDLRFNFSSENGELWAQASLFRALLGWYEAAHDERAIAAVRRAVDVTMQAYPMGQSHPFDVKNDFAGVGHGLVFTDILDRLYQLTGEERYLAYAHWLYVEYSRQPLSQDDVQLAHLLDPQYRFKAHGVHTYEHLRSLLTAAYAAEDAQLDKVLSAALAKLETCLTPSGAPIGDEFIYGRQAHASEIGYEYCSIQELLDTYTHLLQKTGAAQWGDRIEWLLFNAGQGARHPHQPAIAYLKTDNSFSMTGPLHPDDPQDAHNPQIRYKYSPVHQDVAVCCVPNAGRIYPYYVRSMWLSSPSGLAAALYGDCELHTTLNGVKVVIREETRYPFDLAVNLSLEIEQPTAFELALRLPAWADGFELTDANVDEVRDGFILLHRTWRIGDRIALRFMANAAAHSWGKNEVYFSYGPLLFALPLPGAPRPGRSYPLPGFQDEYVEAVGGYAAPLIATGGQAFNLEQGIFDPQRPWESLALCGDLSGRQVRLVPMGGTILRQVTFIKEGNHDAHFTG